MTMLCTWQSGTTHVKTVANVCVVTFISLYLRTAMCVCVCVLCETSHTGELLGLCVCVCMLVCVYVCVRARVCGV